MCSTEETVLQDLLEILKLFVSEFLHNLKELLIRFSKVLFHEQMAELQLSQQTSVSKELMGTVNVSKVQGWIHLKAESHKSYTSYKIIRNRVISLICFHE